MDAFHKFWLLTGALTIPTILAIGLGDWTIVLENLSGPLARGATALIIGVFILGYFLYGLPTALRLSRERGALRIIEKKIPDAEAEPTAQARAVLSLMSDAASGNTLPRGVVLQTFKNLHDRVWRDIGLDRQGEINRGTLQGEFNEENERGMRSMAGFVTLLISLGLLGTMVGILLMMVGQEIPVTADESRQFSFTILSGLSLSVSTSVCGIGSAIIMVLLRAILEGEKHSIDEGFKILMFNTLFPIIHSPRFRDLQQHEKSEDES